MINIEGGINCFLFILYIFDLKYMGNGIELEFDMFFIFLFNFIVYIMKLFIVW